jgi:hypothetical protein
MLPQSGNEKVALVGFVHSAGIRLCLLRAAALARFWPTDRP